MFPVKAMILAAGYGKRLKPLTDKIPKALVEVNGIPMIEHVIRKLKGYGVNEVVVNTHYLSAQVEQFLASKDFGIKVKTLFEFDILGTGGAIKNAAELLAGTGPVIIYNADVLSDCNLNDMYSFHLIREADITLAVNNRKSQRPLLIDQDDTVAGRIIGSKTEIANDYNGIIHQAGFCGMHIIEEKIFSLFPSENVFDIIPFYLSIAGNAKVKAFDIGKVKWYDLGKAETIKLLNKSTQ